MDHETGNEEKEQEEVLHQWEIVTPAGDIGPEVIRMAVPGGYIYRIEGQSFHVKHEEFQSMMGTLFEGLPEMLGFPVPEGKVVDFTVVTDDGGDLPEG